MSRIPNRTSDPDTLKWVEECLADCRASHASCNASADPLLPTRVLDVGLGLVAGDATGRPTVRLVESTGRRGRYACLSHCWGSPASDVIRTTKATLERRRTGIDVSDLPKTFQDAIRLAYRLRIPYLWIDSLCIVQDDDEDWRLEASRMCAVYQNSYLTIAATRASNGTHGLYTDVSPEFHGYKVATIDGQAVYIRRAHNNSAFTHFVAARDADNFPLLGRGWVFQERMLSPRFLHFGHSELTWECSSLFWCQCGDNFATPRGPSQGRRFHSASAAASLDSDGAVEVWQSIVMEYSRLALSFPTDRFPALSGLARQWQAIRGCDYLAGLWRSSLVRDLQWKVESGHQKPKPEAWRAPSWSWASVDSTIRYWGPPLVRMQDGCIVRHASCTAKRNRASSDVADITGELESGLVVISGKLAVSTLDCRDNLLRVGEVVIPGFLPDYAQAPDERRVASESRIREPVMLLRVGVNRSGGNEHTFSLVLRSLDASRQIYERIGSCEHFQGEDGNQVMQPSLFGQSLETEVTII